MLTRILIIFNANTRVQIYIDESTNQLLLTQMLKNIYFQLYLLATKSPKKFFKLQKCFYHQT